MIVPLRFVALVAFGAVLLSTQAAPVEAGSSIVIGNIWSPPATQNAVVYAYIRNGGSSGDSLIGASCPAARSVQLMRTSQSTPSPSAVATPHISLMPGMAATNLPVIASMRQVASASVPAGGALILKPGGLHLMLIGLNRAWNIGDTYEIRLHFKQAGWISTTGVVNEPP